jgi:hypothetical protein
MRPRLVWDGRVRRIGILMRGIETDSVVQLGLGGIREGLAKLGWAEGRNVWLLEGRNVWLLWEGELRDCSELHVSGLLLSPRAD